MTFIKRIKNLWALSNFSITEFDNKLVITKKDNKLVFAVEDKPRLAQVIKRETATEKFLKETKENGI